MDNDLSPSGKGIVGLKLTIWFPDNEILFKDVEKELVGLKLTMLFIGCLFRLVF